MRDPYVVNLASGVQLSLRFPFVAMRRFEKLSGGAFFSDSLNKLGIEYMVAMLAAGVGPGMKPDEIEKKLEAHLEAGGNLPFVVTELTKALQQWGILAPTEEEPAEARPTPAEVPGD